MRSIKLRYNMTTNKTSKRQVDSSYEKLSKTLRQDKDLTALQKILYTYMLDKYMFFSSRGKEFYESLDTLAEEIGVNRTTIHRGLEGLLKIGYVKKITRKKKGAFLECVYEVKDIYGVFNQKASSGEEPEPF